MTFRYRWEIQTKESPYSGTDGTATLSLHGSNGVTEALPLQTDKLGMGELAMGLIEAEEDLGNIVSGTLVATLDPGRPWDIDFVRITRLRDGASWIAAEVGTCTEQGCPLLRFEPVSIYPTVPQEPEKPPAGESQPDEQPELAAEPVVRLAEVRALIRRFKSQLEDIQNLGSPRQAAITRQIGETVQPLLRQLIKVTAEQSRGERPTANTRPSDPLPERSVTRAAETRVVELFGQLNGEKAQLRTLVSVTNGTPTLKRGARVFLTLDQKEGYGLAREGESTATYGALRFSYADKNFDVVALDGFSVVRIPVEYLLGLFGAEWPRIILGDSAQSGAKKGGS